MTSFPSDRRRATALVGLRSLFTEPDIRVLGRHGNREVDLRFEGPDGSYVSCTLLVPPAVAVDRTIEVRQVRAWHAPTNMKVPSIGNEEMQLKEEFLLRAYVDFCRKQVLEALRNAPAGAA